MTISAGRNVRRLAATITLGAALGAAGAAQADCGNRSDFVRGARLAVTGLTADQRLVRFRECAPDRVNEVGPITGFQGADTALVGIDYRVQDGKLYGVGNGGGVYTIDGATAQLTFVNALTAPLSGASFGVDFNPAADRLRIVSDTGQNLRHDVKTGGMTVVDAPLTVASGANVVPAVGIAGAAYTNNDLAADSSTSPRTAWRSSRRRTGSPAAQRRTSCPPATSRSTAKARPASTSTRGSSAALPWTTSGSRRSG